MKIIVEYAFVEKNKKQIFNDVTVTLVLPSKKKKVAELSVLKLGINTETSEAKGS